jgi:hypothetical protein
MVRTVAFELRRDQSNGSPKRMMKSRLVSRPPSGSHGGLAGWLVKVSLGLVRRGSRL